MTVKLGAVTASSDAQAKCAVVWHAFSDEIGISMFPCNEHAYPSCGGESMPPFRKSEELAFWMPDRVRDDPAEGGTAGKLLLTFGPQGVYFYPVETYVYYGLFGSEDRSAFNGIL